MIGARRPEDIGLLLGDADEDHALALAAGRLGEVGLGQGFLPLPPLEVDDRDAPLLGELLDRRHEVLGQLAQELVTGDLLAPVLAQEPGQLIRFLELGHVAVEEHAVDGFVLEQDVLVE